MSNAAAAAPGGLCDQVEVAFPFTATDPDQLSLTLNDKITVIKRNPSGWWVGRDSNGVVGSFPVGYTKPLTVKPKFAVPKELKTAMLLEATTSHAGGGGGPTSTPHVLLTPAGSTASSSAAAALQTVSVSSTTIHVEDHNGAANSTSLRDRASRLGDAPPLSMLQQPLSTSSRMSAADERSMKALLGIDDDDDGGSPVSRLHGGSGSSPGSQRAHMILQTMYSGPQSSAGLHRSLFEATANSSSQRNNSSKASLHPSGRGHDAAAGGLLEQAILLRKQVKWEETRIEKLQSRLQSMQRDRTRKDDAFSELKQQLDHVILTVKLRQLVVADLEKRIDVARRVTTLLTASSGDMERSTNSGSGVDPATEAAVQAVIASYDPHQLALQVAAVTAAAALPSSSVIATSSSAVENPPSSSQPPLDSSSSQTAGSELPQAASLATSSTVPLRPASPAEDQLDSDPIAKKLIRKLKKRLSEAEDTQASYRKQTTKLHRRIAKHKLALQQIDDEIAVLSDAMAIPSTTTTAATTTTGGDQNDDATSATQSGIDDETLPTQRSRRDNDNFDYEQRKGGGDAAAATTPSKRKSLRKLMNSLTDEERDDLEKYQLAEIKLQQKTTKLREQLEGDNAEVAQLKSTVDKLKRRLTKGDEALQVLVNERKECASLIAAHEGNAMQLQQQHTQLQAAVREAATAVNSATKLRDAAAAKVEADRSDLLRRIERESLKTAEFEAELLRLQKAAAEAASATAGKP